MKKKVLKSFIDEFFRAFLGEPFSVNKITIDFSFTSINLFQPEDHTIYEVCSYSGCPKLLQENNKMHDKSVLLGSLI